MHLEEEDADDGEDQESDDPDGIKGVMEDFMVQLARAVKESKQMRNAATIAAALNILFVIAHS